MKAASAQSLPADARAPHAGGASPALPSLTGARLIKGLSQVLGGQVVIVLAGLLSLPVLARQLGPAGYGAFSLFTTLLAALSQLDFARPLLIREGSRLAPERALPAQLSALGMADALLLAVLATLVATAQFELAAAALFVAAVGLHGLASRSFALLSARGRAGVAMGLRNAVWGGAVLAAAGCAVLTQRVSACIWPFALANAVLLAVYSRLAHERVLPGATTWRRLRSATWGRAVALRHGGAVRDILGHTVGVSVMVAAHRLILENTADAATFGIYSGQADLVIKLSLFASALATVLYPMLARGVQEDGEAVARAHFLKLSAWIVPLWFVALVALMLSDAAVVRLVLGREYLAGRALFPLLLIGTFLHLFGFLLTSWQRARGDFAAQRRAYGFGALLGVGLGLVLIPTFGPAGAALSYVGSRLSDLTLVAHEVRRTERGQRPWASIAVAATLLAALVGLAWWRIGLAGGLLGAA